MCVEVGAREFFIHFRHLRTDLARHRKDGIMLDRTDTHLLDFGVGMLMGLVRAGQTTLDERRLVDTHKAFVAAFQVVEAEIDKAGLRFRITTNQFHGTSPDVDTIFRYWLSSGFATKDAPGTIYRFRISRSSADRILETLVGGAELYDKATTAYFDYMNTPSTRRQVP